MARPYSTTAQVLGPALKALVTSAQWNVTELTGDVAALIVEGDNEIDGRLAALGYTLPIPSAPVGAINATPVLVNPPLLQDLSVLYARMACFRELYAGGQPQDQNGTMKEYEDKVEKKWLNLEEGWAELIDVNGAIIPKTKFQTLTIAEHSSGSSAKDEYPNYPSGPYPDPPGIGR